MLLLFKTCEVLCACVAILQHCNVSMMDTNVKCCLSSINLNFINCDIFSRTISCPAQPHLYILSGAGWQLPVEPGRVVEAAGCETATPLPIPQGVV